MLHINQALQPTSRFIIIYVTNKSFKNNFVSYVKHFSKTNMKKRVTIQKRLSV